MNSKATAACLQAFEPRNHNVYRGYFPVQPGILSCKEGFEVVQGVQKAFLDQLSQL